MKDTRHATDSSHTFTMKPRTQLKSHASRGCGPEARFDDGEAGMDKC